MEDTIERKVLHIVLPESWGVSREVKRRDQPEIELRRKAWREIEAELESEEIGMEAETGIEAEIGIEIEAEIDTEVEIETDIETETETEMKMKIEINEERKLIIMETDMKAKQNTRPKAVILTRKRLSLRVHLMVALQKAVNESTACREGNTSTRSIHSHIRESGDTHPHPQLHLKAPHQNNKR